MSANEGLVPLISVRKSETFRDWLFGLPELLFDLNFHVAVLLVPWNLNTCAFELSYILGYTAPPSKKTGLVEHPEAPVGHVEDTSV